MNNLKITQQWVANWYLRENSNIKFENKVHQGYLFCVEEYLLGSYFVQKSRKTADFMKINLAVCKEKKRKIVSAGFRYQRKQLIYNEKVFRLI